MKNKVKICIILTAVLLFTMTLSTPAMPFGDVQESDTYYSAITYCRDKGFVYGISDIVFHPDTTLTRAQFAAIWCRTLNADEYNHQFNDVTSLKNGHDTTAIVLYSLGIMNGTGENIFSPNSTVTREQLAVMAKRTYKLSASDAEQYMVYSDNADVSDWARNGISACMNAELFKGLYDNEAFQPKKPITRAELCKFIYNIMKPSYKVIIADMEGGTISASPSTAHPGTVITLTITPDEGMQLKDGTLKINGNAITGTSFTMPEKDVVVAAQFESITSPLNSIIITTQPEKTSYTAGEELDLTGLIVTAIYENDTSAEVTGYTSSPASGEVLTEEGPVTVTVSYTESGITKTADFTLTVSNAQSATEHETITEIETTTETETETTTEIETTTEAGA